MIWRTQITREGYWLILGALAVAAVLMLAAVIAWG
jgi:hypothetical protein